MCLLITQVSCSECSQHLDGYPLHVIKWWQRGDSGVWRKTFFSLAVFDLNTNRNTRFGFLNKIPRTQDACRVIWSRIYSPIYEGSVFYKKKMAESVECKRHENLFFSITLKSVYLGQVLLRSKDLTSRFTVNLPEK
jgi:hypothetical protein